MTIMDLYNNGHLMSNSELLDLAKQQIAVILTRVCGEQLSRNYIDNIFLTFSIADDGPTFEEYRFYDACGANHRKYSYEKFVEESRRCKRIDFMSIIANHFHEEPQNVRLAVCAFAVIICACDGKINGAERAYLSTIMKL